MPARRLRRIDQLVEAGHCAILFSRWSGVGDTVYGEGLHFMVPWLHIPQIFNVRTKPTSFGTLTGSKGMRKVAGGSGGIMRCGWDFALEEGWTFVLMEIVS